MKISETSKSEQSHFSKILQIQSCHVEYFFLIELETISASLAQISRLLFFSPNLLIWSENLWNLKKRTITFFKNIADTELTCGIFLFYWIRNNICEFGSNILTFIFYSQFSVIKWKSLIPQKANNHIFQKYCRYRAVMWNISFLFN